MTVQRFLFYISYQGCPYRGLQSQNLPEYVMQVKTVVGTIEDALKIFKPANEIRCITSSRTDAGVHAFCNTVHLDLQPRENFPEYKPEYLQIGLNSKFMKKDENIRILKVLRVSNDFHCRFYCIGRRYLYRLAVPKVDLKRRLLPMSAINNRFLHVTKSNFDVDKAQKACDILTGEHDFTAYTNPSYVYPWQNPVKNMKIEMKESSPMLEIHNPFGEDMFRYYDIYISSKSFLNKQVRKMVAGICSVAHGKMTFDEMHETLEKPKQFVGVSALHSVPAYGLYLTNVKYNEEDLIYKGDTCTCSSNEESQSQGQTDTSSSDLLDIPKNSSEDVKNAMMSSVLENKDGENR